MLPSVQLHFYSPSTRGRKQRFLTKIEQQIMLIFKISIRPPISVVYQR